MSTGEKEYFKAKYQRLEDLPGIGPASARDLKNAGFNTVENVATAEPSELLEAGLGEVTAANVISAARKTLGSKWITGTELAKQQERIKKLTTGVRSLDVLLDGGVETTTITEVVGEYGAGKSQLCQQLAVTVQLPKGEGGLDGGALYLDTENVFRTHRIAQLAESFDLDPGKVLKKIVYAEAFTSSHQMILIDNADEVIKENDIRLIIVDSVIAHFRSEYLGREMLAPRQQNLNRHLHKIKRLAGAFNLAVVVTNQVASTPDVYSGGRAEAVGGHILGHASATRLYIRKGRKNLRIAKILASPTLPEGGEAPFRITREGITFEGDL